MRRTDAGETAVEASGRRRVTPRRASAPGDGSRTARSVVARGEAAVDDTRRAAAFRRDGGLAALRQLAARTDDPRVRTRAQAVLRAFARLARATGWTTASDRTVEGSATPIHSRDTSRPHG